LGPSVTVKDEGGVELGEQSVQPLPGTSTKGRLDGTPKLPKIGDSEQDVGASSSRAAGIQELGGPSQPHSLVGR